MNSARCEVFTAVTMKNTVFWDVTQCDSLRTEVLEERIASIIRVTRFGELGATLTVTPTEAYCEETVTLLSLLRLLVTTNIVPSSPILVTPMMEVIRSSETSLLTRASRRYNPEHGILQ
jgi:hypothetical protein